MDVRYMQIQNLAHAPNSPPQSGMDVESAPQQTSKLLRYQQLFSVNLLGEL
jgi:hypothetical protein